MTNCYDQSYAESFFYYEQSMYNLLKTFTKVFKFLMEWKELVAYVFLITKSVYVNYRKFGEWRSITLPKIEN